MASRKSVVFTKCSFSFTLREKGKEWGSCPPQPQPPPSTVRALNSCPLPRGTHCPPPPPPQPHILGQPMDAARQVLRHRPALHGLDADLLQRLSEPGGSALSSSRGPAVPHAPRGAALEHPPPPPAPHPTHLISSGLLSSLPRCSSPRVQAKMLAMGLVLVGRPCGQTAPHSAVSPGPLTQGPLRAQPTFWCSR